MKQRKRIEWVKDSELAILFSQKPNIILREPTDAKNKFELRSIKKFPMRNLEPFVCTISDHTSFKKHEFIVPKMNYDGASIPCFLWFLIGANTNPFYKIPSLIHDVICNNHELIGYDRKLSSKVFRALLLKEGVSVFKANIMYYAVDIFQRFIVNW